MKTRLVGSLLVATLALGCANYTVQPENVASTKNPHVKGKRKNGFRNGIQVLTSTQTRSKVQVEVAQRRIKGLDNPPLVIYVGAQIIEGAPVDFDTGNIAVSENNKPLPVLNFNQMRKSSYDFEPVLLLYGIATPSVPITQDNLSPALMYAGQGNFLAYGTFLSTPFMIMDDEQTEALMQEERQAFKIMEINYLRRSTLNPGKARGGFVVIDPRNIVPGTLVIKVALANEVHEFKIDIGSGS